MSQSGSHFIQDVPSAQRTVVATSTVVFDDAGLLLMVRRRGNSGVVSHHLPQGPAFAGESVAFAASRVVAEATGVGVEITGLVGIYDDPSSTGQLALCFRGRPVDGQLGADAVWVEPERLDELDVPLSVRRRVEHGLDVSEPFFA